MTDSTVQFAAAVALLRGGDAAGAERLLRRLVADAPDQAAGWHLLGVIAGRDGRADDCISWLRRALAIGDAAHRLTLGFALGEAYRRAGRLGEAQTVLDQVTCDAPSSAEAWLRLGLLRLGAGQAPAAIAPLRQAAILASDLAVAHGSLAAALRITGALDEAAQSAMQALALAPDDASFVGELAKIQHARGRFAEAALLCRKALARAEDAALLNTLGISLKELGSLSKATGCFERALTLQPGLIDAQYNLAGVRKDQGRTDEAIALLQAVVASAPDLAAARFALCMAHLPPLYRDNAEVARRKADYATALDALIAHAECVGAGTLAAGVGAAQPFYLAYQGGCEVALQRRYGALVCRSMAEAHGPQPLAPQPTPGQRIRIGIVSGYFRDHSVWRLPTRGWVQHLDRTRFELFGYHTSALRDAETDCATASFDHFVQGPLLTEAWLQQIAGDQIHALIYPEIGMDPMVARLAALRLAPVQYASWGHPVTTGYPTIDFFLSSADMEPDNAEQHYTETLVRLPGLSTPIAIKPIERDGASCRQWGWPDGAVVYWCGQTLSKYLPEFDAIYPAIAARVSTARFVFLAFPGSADLTQRFRDRLDDAFARMGLAAADFCIFLPHLPPAGFRSVMVSADIVLDSIGWSGCNSLVEALALNLPVVTLPGQTMRSRHATAMLRSLKLDASVCDMIETYIDQAVLLGQNPDHRQVAVAHEAEIIWQDPAPVRALERHIIAIAMND